LDTTDQAGRRIETRVSRQNFLAEIKLGLCLFIVAVSSAVPPGVIALSVGGNLLP
jgi:hypothetical protein